MRNFTIILIALLLSGGLQAQNTLTVKCYTDNRVFNSILLNNEIVEYAVCDTGFYVAVADYETCEFWKTNFNNNNPANDFGNYNNNNSTCRMRSERFFLFRYNQPNELSGMLNMLQQIPDGNPLVIYTPIMYDPVLVASTSPALMTELENRWGVSALADPQIKILFGKQGDAASYVNAVPQAGADSVVFSTPVCSGLGWDETALQQVKLMRLNETTWSVSGLDALSAVELLTINGQRHVLEVDGNELILPANLSSGVYIVRGNSEKGLWQGRLMIY